MPNWSDIHSVFPVDSGNKLRERELLNGSFVVTYSGNLGLTQRLEPYLEAAARLAEDGSEPVQFLFIGEGAGKSTNIEFIKEYLSRQGIDLLCTREPGGTIYAEKIRELLLDPEAPMKPSDMELLFRDAFTSRAGDQAR